MVWAIQIPSIVRELIGLIQWGLFIWGGGTVLWGGVQFARSLNHQDANRGSDSIGQIIGGVLLFSLGFVAAGLLNVSV